MREKTNFKISILLLRAVLADGKLGSLLASFLHNFTIKSRILQAVIYAAQRKRITCKKLLDCKKRKCYYSMRIFIIL